MRPEVWERGKLVARQSLGYGRGERRNVGEIGIRNKRGGEQRVVCSSKDQKGDQGKIEQIKLTRDQVVRWKGSGDHCVGMCFVFSFIC